VMFGIPFPAVQEIFVGCAYNYLGTVTEANSTFGWRFKEGSTDHLTMRVNASGKLELWRGAAVTLLETSVQTLFQDTYNYIEVRVKISNTVGEWEVRVNGEVYLKDVVGDKDTQSGGTSVVDSIQLGNTRQAITLIDDVYICDTAGAQNNTFLGDIQVKTVVPDADGGHVAWTRSTGANDWEVVDELPTNETDYLSTSVLNDKTTQDFAALPGDNGTILAVCHVIHAAKFDGGIRSLKSLARPVAADTLGSNEMFQSSDFTMQSEIWELNPDTSSAWTEAEVNAGEFGIQVVS
ncbi:MAG: hypothetical protein KAJ03_06990, partial [Gammaproteobacteria bacterium]|nr:hypothetical protein [Gammaproteobacteria bacterium]